MPREWTEQELKIVNKLAWKIPWLEIQKVLKDRSLVAIKHRAPPQPKAEIDLEYYKKLLKVVDG